MVADEELLFNLALSIEIRSEREAFLDHRCQRDSALRARLAKLLQAYESSDFIESTNEQVNSLLSQAKQESLLNTQLGPFVIREWLGEGGMGEVYLGERSNGDLPNFVAIKLLKPWMNSREVFSRFQLEQWALEQMDHPNIAKFIASGCSDSERPYFAMEWVNGIPITEYCNRFCMSIRERLVLYLQLVEAVSHVHEKKIVHRDLKPSNVLVERHQSRSEVKIIDFGIAKACMPGVESGPDRTRCQQWLGSADYMSPEQKRWSSDVDLRSDVYSLGVILFELLTGQLPGSPTEADISQQESTNSISDKPRTLGQVPPSLTPETLSKVCQERNTNHRELQKSLKGDLEWIVMKALEYSRDQRYPDAGWMADDIQAVLEHRKPKAGSPSFLVQCTRWHRRNAVVSYASLAVFSLVALCAGFFVQQWSKQLATHRLNSLENALQDSDADRLQLQFFSDLKNASELLAVGDRFQARALLRPWNENATNYRDHFALNFLNTLQSQSHSKWIAHSADLLDLDISKDGRRMVTCDKSGEFAIWDRVEHQLLRRVRPVEGEITNASFSPDGKWVVSVGTDTLVRIWNADSDLEPLSLSGHERTINGLAWSPDGKYIATADRDGVVNVWDFASRKLDRVLSKQTEPVRVLAWSPDGHWIAAGEGDRGVRLFKSSDWSDAGFIDSMGRAPLAIAFSADSKSMVFGGYGGDLTFVDMERLTKSQVMKTTLQITSIAFLDSQQILAGSSDGRVQILFRDNDRWSSARIVNLEVDTWIRSIVPIANCNQVIVATQKDSALRCFETEALTAFRHSNWSSNPVYPASATPMILEFGKKGIDASMHRVGSAEPMFQIADPVITECSCHYYPDSKLVFVGTRRATGDTENHFVDAYDSEGQLAWSSPFQGVLHDIGISRDSKYLVASGSPGRVAVWDIESHKSHDLLGDGERYLYPAFCVFSPNNESLLVSHAGTKSLMRYRMGTWELQGEVRTETGIGAMRLSPSGDFLLVGESDRVSAWTPNLEHRLWQVFLAPSTPSSRIYAMAVSEDESTLATYCDDASVRIIDTATKTEVLKIPAPKLAICRLEFTDSQTLKILAFPNECYELRAK